MLKDLSETRVRRDPRVTPATQVLLVPMVRMVLRDRRVFKDLSAILAPKDLLAKPELKDLLAILVHRASRAIPVIPDRRALRAILAIRAQLVQLVPQAMPTYRYLLSVAAILHGRSPRESPKYALSPLAAVGVVAAVDAVRLLRFVVAVVAALVAVCRSSIFLLRSLAQPKP